MADEDSRSNKENEPRVISLAEMREKKLKAKSIIPPEHQRDPKKPPTQQEVFLWQTAQSSDEVVKDAIINKGLAPNEVASVIAHRLGTLISTTDSPDVLQKFCVELIHRLVS